jgi:hypothetical protein
VVSDNYATGHLLLTYHIIDVPTDTTLARFQTQGTGSFQDAVVRAEVSYDGEVLATASWGDAGNSHPEVQIFTRTGTLVGSINTPGSPTDMNLSRDGHFLVAGCKAVHANVFGNGGDVFVYDTRVS